MNKVRPEPHPKVLPADPKLLEYAEESGMTPRMVEVYSAYLALTREMGGEKPSMAAIAKYVGGKTDSGTVSRSIRKAQARAEVKGWSSAHALKVDEDVAQRNIRLIERKLKNQVSTYVVTWAQNDTPVNQPFLDSLKKYCEHNNAVLVVIAGRYKNPNSLWTRGQAASEYWVEEVAPYLIEHRIDLNDNLTIMGDIKTQPTAERPLSGFQSITRDRSGIFGHAKVSLDAIATPQNKFPKLLTTTGAVTIRNYIDAKAGKKGEFHHTFGATVVEIQGDLFHMRQINACDDGSFIDLDTEYSGKKVEKAGRAEALVLGDIHADFMDDDCEEAIFGKAGLLDYFNPKHVVFHDLFDGYSGSHHHKGQLFTKLAKHKSGKNNVREEVVRTLDKLQSWLRPGIDFHVVDSNHNRHLTQWIQETDPRYDLENISFWSEIVGMMEPGVIMGDGGAEYPNPLQLMSEKLIPSKNLHFLTKTDRLMIQDIDLTNHGDRGPNGSRGSLRGFSAIGTKVITGHGHTPGIWHGHYRVGTNSRFDLEYTGDLSSWLHTDAVIYANGKRTLIHKFGTSWRAIRGKKNET